VFKTIILNKKRKVRMILPSFIHTSENTSIRKRSGGAYLSPVEDILARDEETARGIIESCSSPISVMTLVMLAVTGSTRN